MSVSRKSQPVNIIMITHHHFVTHYGSDGMDCIFSIISISIFKTLRAYGYPQPSLGPRSPSSLFLLPLSVVMKCGVYFWSASLCSDRQFWTLMVQKPFRLGGNRKEQGEKKQKRKGEDQNEHGGDCLRVIQPQQKNNCPFYPHVLFKNRPSLVD